LEPIRCRRRRNREVVLSADFSDLQNGAAAGVLDPRVQKKLEEKNERQIVQMSFHRWWSGSTRPVVTASILCRPALFLSALVTPFGPTTQAWDNNNMERQSESITERGEKERGDKTCIFTGGSQTPQLLSVTQNRKSCAGRTQNAKNKNKKNEGAHESRSLRPRRSAVVSGAITGGAVVAQLNQREAFVADRLVHHEIPADRESACGESDDETMINCVATSIAI
jgi:hypothetical protein